MASRNINNPINSSLEFVLRGTVVFLRSLGPSSNQKPFQSLHTRVCNRTRLCLQRRPHTEVRSPTKTTFSQVKKKTEWCSRHFPKLWSDEMWPPSFPDLNPMNFCVLSFLETRACSVAHTSVENLKRSLVRE